MRATLEKAKELAMLLEPLALPFGFHIGLGGGTIHKTGERKDIDILLYRRRVDIKNPEGKFDFEKLFEAFETVGLKRVVINQRPDFWCTKCTWQDGERMLPFINVDVLYPEALHDNEAYGERVADVWKPLPDDDVIKNAEHLLEHFKSLAGDFS